MDTELDALDVLDPVIDLDSDLPARVERGTAAADSSLYGNLVGVATGTTTLAETASEFVQNTVGTIAGGAAQLAGVQLGGGISPGEARLMSTICSMLRVRPSQLSELRDALSALASLSDEDIDAYIEIRNSL